MTSVERTLLVVAHFVCPLLFFTNLTRNPYITQICLLNICLASALALRLLSSAYGRDARLSLPKTPLDLPLAFMAAAGLVSWGVAYFGHEAFFRPAIISEGLRGGIFFAVNGVAVFYLSASLPRRDNGPAGVPLGWWSGLTLLWGLLWTAYPQMRSPVSNSLSIRALVWDGYGAFLWGLGLFGACRLCRRGRAVDFIHLAFAIGFLASVYGMFQYFNHEFIWPNVLNPYGGRSVSTFGNPNFLSSYNVVLFPMAAVCFLEASGGFERLVYGALLLTLEAGLLCSMTRSSWGGAVLALLLLALSPQLRLRAASQPRPAGLLAGLGLAMALLWPQSSIASGYTPSVIGRLSEMAQLADEKAGHYSPWHQRILIWTCAWLMGQENPLTGKGFGLFELFYPFYQGPILDAIEFVRGMRTHANNSHNEILEAWAQGGLLGLGAAAALWTAFFASVWRWRKAGAGRTSLWFGAAAGAAGMLADNMLNVSLHFAVPGFMFWWAAGLAMGGPAQEDGLRRSAPPGTPSRVAAAALAFFLFGACWVAVRVWNREVHYFAGFKLLRQGAMPAAIKRLELSRSWGPGEVNAVYELGNAYARTDRYLEADAAYASALRANAGYDEIYYNIGAVKSQRLGRLEEGIRHYQVCLLINPLSNEAYNALTALYLQNPARYAAQARALLERAVRIFPGNPNYWHNLGYLEAFEKRWEESERAYTEALTIAPDAASSESSLRGVARQSGRKPVPILAALAEIRQLDSSVGRADYSEATLSLALRLAERFPRLLKARFLAGSLLLVRGRPAEAVPHLEWVAQREPRHSAALGNLASAYVLLGRRADGIKRFQQALAADPSNGAARQRLKELGVERP
jgi:tetratricopeptide (TPR) repeat protein/O-antigen ligase